MNPNRSTRGSYIWPALVLMVAVFVWGAYIAIGAATNEAKDVRKAAMIIGCTIAFLVFWLIFLFRGSVDRTAGEADGGRWNVASVLSFIAALGANGMVWPTWLLQEQLADLTQGRLIVAAVATAGFSSVAAVVGLSRKASPRGHRLAFVAAALLVVALVVGVISLNKSAARVAVSQNVLSTVGVERVGSLFRPFGSDDCGLRTPKKTPDPVSRPAPLFSSVAGVGR
jgi:hypothetical protein